MVSAVLGAVMYPLYFFVDVNDGDNERSICFREHVFDNPHLHYIWWLCAARTAYVFVFEKVKKSETL